MAVMSNSRLIWILAMFAFSMSLASAIYCDEDDCYDLLGLIQSANTADIKKAYYKLSLKYHPDKNPNPEARVLFVKIANAYEILKDGATREQYDYAIAHPEQVFYNTARYYQSYYGHQTDLRAVLTGLLVILSGFQYLNQWTRYTQMMNMVKQTPAYKNKLKALELERCGAPRGKKKPTKAKDRGSSEEVCSKELDLQIHGAEKPTIWNLIAIRFLLVPYTIGKLLYWKFFWMWRYWIKHMPYAREDAGYLTRTCLRISSGAWSSMDETVKDDLISKCLWIPANMDNYRLDLKKESKRRR